MWIGTVNGQITMRSTYKLLKNELNLPPQGSSSSMQVVPAFWNVGLVNCSFKQDLMFFMESMPRNFAHDNKIIQKRNHILFFSCLLLL